MAERFGASVQYDYLKGTAAEIGSFFKRVEIAVLNKSVAGSKVMVQPSK